jgi:hypothetical protein
MWLHLITSKCVLFIPRSASTSIRSVISSLYPADISITPRSFSIPEGFTPYALIRDPVDRFISACAKTGKSPADALKMFSDFDERIPGQSPINQTYVDVHFESLETRGLTDLVLPNVQLFKFETGINAFCSAVGFDSLPHENESEQRPTLTSDEETAVRAYYARDIRIWEGIA